MEVTLGAENKVTIQKAQSMEEQLKEMQLKLESISKMFFVLRKNGKLKKNLPKKALPGFSKDNIPCNTCYIGYTPNSEHPYVLTVDEKGNYMIGTTKFNSLDESATYICGAPTNGWLFWTSIEGETLQRLYNADKKGV